MTWAECSPLGLHRCNTSSTRPTPTEVAYRLGTGVVGRCRHHPHPFAVAPHWFARQLTFVTYSWTSRPAPVVGGWLRLTLVWYQRGSIFCGRGSGRRSIPSRHAVARGSIRGDRRGCSRAPPPNSAIRRSRRSSRLSLDITRTSQRNLMAPRCGTVRTPTVMMASTFDSGRPRMCRSPRPKTAGRQDRSVRCGPVRPRFLFECSSITDSACGRLFPRRSA